MNEVSIDELVSYVKDGMLLGVPTHTGDFTAVPMAATRQIIRAGRKDLHLVCAPSSSMQADMLIGAGCVASIQAGVISLNEYGSAGRWLEAQRDGTLEVRESTCPAIYAGLLAGEKGVPFMPVRGILGSDIVALRPDWRVIENPFEPTERILVVPAINPDVSIIHVPLMDEEGNLWIGRRASLRLLAHASRTTLATYEKRVEGNFMDDVYKRPGVIPAHYVGAVSHQPKGSWPLHLGRDYPEDAAHLRRYAQASKSRAAFDEYLRCEVFHEHMEA